MEAHQDDEIMIMEEMKSHVKGKRTKRRRPSSALTLTLTSTTSSSSTTTMDDDGAPANPTGFFQLPTIEFTNITYDNNDEYMANCLILLAQGGHHLRPQPPSNAAVQPPLYVYECKTCNRGFTSFQALGGHRASHNKPHKDFNHDHLSKNRSSLSISTPNKNLLSGISGSNKGPKVHECSICGSDFPSGQALGGHMRRHRSMTMNESKKLKTVLPLDLNLPAPIEDDDHKETGFRFGSNDQIIVFSTTSLVDCHF